MISIVSGEKIKLKKLTVECRDDEVYYPVVSIKHATADVAGSAAEKVIDEKMPVEQEVVKVVEGTAEVVEAVNKEPEVVESLDSVKVRPRRSGLKIWYSRVGALVTLVVAVIAVALVGMRIAGFKTFTVLSGSMEPEYPVGSMLYVKPVDYQSLKVGDVISYVANDDKTIVTHRIVAVEIDKEDASVWRFKTKGDANASADAKLVHYKNVLGTPAITIPLIGYIAHNIQQPPGLYIVLVVGTLLLAWTFLPGTLEERRKTARKSVA